MKFTIIGLLITMTAFQTPRLENMYGTDSNIKDDALLILAAKCNICHINKNPSKVFTIENMNGFSNKINRQVFVWKRMPKGREIKLNAQEKQTLKKWINSIK